MARVGLANRIRKIVLWGNSSLFLLFYRDRTRSRQEGRTPACNLCNLAGVHDVSVACVAEAALGQLVEGRFAGDLGRCESRQVIRLTVKMNSQERNRRILNTDHLNKDIGRRAARGGIIAIAAQPIRMFMQFFITAVLARLLAPDAFGLVAMAAAVTGFVAYSPSSA